MFGKQEWFKRRKYGGWGLTPKTWQGWAYIVAMVAPIALMQSLGLNGDKIFYLTLAWCIVFVIDMVDIMAKLKKDERETQIEAISDRNSAWAMVAVIAAGIAYQVATSVVSKDPNIDPFLLAALLVGAFVKGATNIYLEKKM